MTIRSVRNALWLAFTLVSCVPGPVAAQSLDSLRTVVQRAQRAHWSLRVASPSDTIAGRVRLIDQWLLVGRTRVDTATVVEVSRRTIDTHTVIASSSAGGIMLGVFGYHAIPCRPQFDCRSEQWAVAGIATAIGALLGALVGERASQKEWVVLWSR